MAVLSVYQNWNPWVAILVGLLTGTLIGLINGFFIAVLRVPSFIVTLAGSIGYAGLLLLVLGRQTTLDVRDSTIRSLAPTYTLPGYRRYFFKRGAEVEPLAGGNAPTPPSIKIYGLTQYISIPIWAGSFP